MNSQNKNIYIGNTSAFAALSLDLKALENGKPVEEAVSIITGPKTDASALADEALELKMRFPGIKFPS